MKKKRRVKKKYIRLGIVFLVLICILSALGFGGYYIYATFFEEKIPERIVATPDQYDELDVDEVGEIPVMMYHSIESDVTSEETEYTGGNIDPDGYHRTADAFRKDLDFYYESGYRCIRLDDYLDGYIDCDAGTSPIVLTFDDGYDNCCLVTGEDEEGNIIIDPNSAVGIMEEYKKKYPDMNITATFFLNGGLFRQPDYNEKIINWMVDHGYDIGNHTKKHPDFTAIDGEESEYQVGYMYNLLDQIIPGKYVNIVALPYGSPYEIEHENIPHILKATYEGVTYETKAVLRVNWKANESPFADGFESNFIKRIRAYDNNGEVCDIEANFIIQTLTRYISDGDPNTVVVRKSKKDLVKKEFCKDKEIIYFD